MARPRTPKTPKPANKQLYFVDRDVQGYEGPYEYLLPYEALTRWERVKLGLEAPSATHAPRSTARDRTARPT